MANENFTLSVSLAHELEKAFKRNNWTVEEVEKLVGGTVLGEMLHIVNNSTVKAQLGLGYPVKIEEVFTWYLCCKELKYPERLLNRLISALKVDKRVLLVDLVSMGEGEVLRVDNIGRHCLQLVKDVFAKHYLEFSSSYPTPYPEP
ncbi:hypothetical protein A3D66_02750 [Candidatus Kaiserbacteria bacterium RIFCSPHIGHO2_02_FULL_50_9]|uniref:Uncharacterized protein n=1 Tax=Candidatus Kaiserbacteria bacterium RIFCSPLOWO2_01_FULL_51_21 TaxID=1798508 RepID=A0A1F6EDC9_9BACT|nr:MAG: hypothetical protein A2761_02680 [Candidatus Kaiserbacteria bacterium RIFCSPHIGHO2_01_FULL_51_33]OGG63696.1 MAG: hypothetical protein A3D66_02750 [Candidatus Kaiserbacteria bacterium RIFCSPHIGHO2_02_FULL_50_9]OGG71683.1 MAG: hypothetical protein A3A35_00770 [Candidatus Kaiserbacteria bacterium RIFCSPLOWO2_01_FULL_51_21]